MSNEEILIKAIEKAIAGGWNIEVVGAFTDWEIDDNGLYDDRDYYTTERVTPKEIIFNHDFAKALWSGLYMESLKVGEPGKILESKGMALWKHHLQQMVVASNPIQYLSDNLD